MAKDPRPHRWRLRDQPGQPVNRRRATFQPSKSATTPQIGPVVSTAVIAAALTAGMAVNLALTAGMAVNLALAVALVSIR